MKGLKKILSTIALSAIGITGCTLPESNGKLYLVDRAYSSDYKAVFNGPEAGRWKPYSPTRDFPNPDYDMIVHDSEVKKLGLNPDTLCEYIPRKSVF